MNTILHRIKHNRSGSERLWILRSTDDLLVACETMISKSLPKAKREDQLGDYSKRLLDGEKIRAKNCIYWITNGESDV